MNKCGRAVSRRVHDVIPQAEVCLHCRMACIDRKVRERGFAGIGYIGPIKDQRGRNRCIRCLKLLAAERVKVNDRTCLSCQQHFEQLNDGFYRVETARNCKLPHVNPHGLSQEEGGFRRSRLTLKTALL